ncbi:MAG: hypothetical protein LBC61_07915 [Candidatus Peribacteria bacterium]|nr:hypothetical protein [Candidatus Peribacteria bacterium]
MKNQAKTLISHYYEDSHYNSKITIPPPTNLSYKAREKQIPFSIVGKI